jgi:uncharacterized membrane protein
MRGREVTRLEGFSDAVFGFALTLLVVSLEVPESFPALKQTLSGFIPFAATFAIVSWIWIEHYSFFLRFSLRDNLTVFLNLVLLFVVLFFAYPLKFVLTRLVAGMTGIGMPAGNQGLESLPPADARLLMVTYSAGFVAVFTILALFYWNALRRREELALTPLEAFDARAGVRAHLLSVAIGTVSIVAALMLPMSRFWIAGFVYFLLGPVQGTNGRMNGAARARLVASLG